MAKYLWLDFKIPKYLNRRIRNGVSAGLIYLCGVSILQSKLSIPVAIFLICLLMFIFVAIDFVCVTHKHKALFDENGNYKTYVINQLLIYLLGVIMVVLGTIFVRSL